jgi:hypothetical protein
MKLRSYCATNCEVRGHVVKQFVSGGRLQRYVLCSIGLFAGSYQVRKLHISNDMFKGLIIRERICGLRLPSVHQAGMCKDQQNRILSELT